jgi:hypothetical protein
MGTTCLNYIPANKREYLDSLLTHGGPEYSYRVLKSAMSGGNYYAAVEHMRPGEPVTVFAAVIKVNVYKPKTAPEFCYKEMTEDCEPYYYDCPVAILDLLTPTDNASANTWRAKCRDNLARKATLRKTASAVKIGDVVTFARPVKYGASEVQRVTIIDRRKRYWVGSTGTGRYQVPARLLVGATIEHA